MESTHMIAGRYQLGEEIGVGGMGTVFHGKDTVTNAHVAIKHLHNNIAHGAIIERFKREGEALRELNHPNIVKMLDAFEANGNYYLVMEYEQGGDLASLLEQETLSLDRIFSLAIDLADALTRAHKLDIVHRDLKPANVLIADDGTLRLTDFGVAHVGSQERITETGAIVGTIDYLPPEAFNELLFDERGDIWAFGVILFEMLAGQRPFTGKSIIQVIGAIAYDPVPDLEELAPNAPIALIDLVYRMLERDLYARVPSVRIVGAELEAIAQGRSRTTPSPTRFASPTPEIFSRPKHNLPSQATPFVGRDVELAELDKLLSDKSKRLITVLAPGGMGKTRLALASAEQHLDEFADGVYFVDLTALTDAASIPTTIIDSAGFSLSSDKRSPKEQLLNLLANKNILLVMDNFEHVIDGASIVSEILQVAPDVQIVATSRVRLEQQGETLFHLSGMDFPEWETPADAIEYGAVKIFLNSATRANPAFELTQDNLQYVARICRLVAGMPLGIVLSASWMGVLSAEEVADEVANSIDFLAASSNDIPERQRSIQAVFDYSWQLMTPDEQAIYMKMSYFQGGFSRTAGQRVTGASLRDLMTLVSKSLLRRDSETGRYSIHELARQFAFDRLMNSGELNTVADAHMQYYVDALIDLTPKLKGGDDQLKAFINLENDFENVRVAWHHARKSNNWIALTHIAEAIWLLDHRGRENDVLELFLPVIKHRRDKNEVDEGQEIALAALGTHLPRVGKIPFEEQEIIIRRGIELARKHQQKQMIATGLGRLAFCVMSMSPLTEGEALVKEAIAVARDINDHFLLSYNLFRLGYIHLRQGNVKERAVAYNESLKFSRQIKNKMLMSNVISNIAGDVQDKEQRIEMYLEALRLSRESGYTNFLPNFIAIIINEYFSLLEWDKGEPFLEELEVLANASNAPRDVAALLRAKSWRFAFNEDYNTAHDLVVQAENVILSDSHQMNWLPGIRSEIGRYKIWLDNFAEGLSLIKDNYERITYNSGSIGAKIDTLIPLIYLLEQQQDTIQQIEVIALHQAQQMITLYRKQFPYVVRKHAELKEQTDPAIFEAAWERGKQLDLGNTVERLLHEFYEYYGVE